MGWNCSRVDGNGPPRPVTISDLRIDLNDTTEPYSIADNVIEKAIRNAMIVGKSEFDICIDVLTKWPCTDYDAYIVEQLAYIWLLENHLVQIRGGGGGGNGAQSGTQCSGASYNAFIDSMSEGGSSISFASIGDIQSIIEKKREELEKLKLGRWGCAIEVTVGNY